MAIGYGGLTLLFTVATAGLTGCAAPSNLGPSRLGATMAQGPGGSSILAGPPRVVGTHVNARAPVSLTVEDGAVSVRFARLRSRETLIRLDPYSLDPREPEVEAPVPDGAPSPLESVRSDLGDGRFLECFKSGDVEEGYRLMVQAWTAGGSRLGDPVTISEPDADVLGQPKLVAIDDAHAVAAFIAMRDDGAELLVVPLEVP
jgi:hypothetical protein